LRSIIIYRCTLVNSGADYVMTGLQSNSETAARHTDR